ncbi:MAG: hypothetical protein HY816_01060 [Candidatus Wallbacteria bacterium]|nr:hypothetical protein [Candidatus Wallbacteria bacterium]
MSRTLLVLLLVATLGAASALAEDLFDGLTVAAVTPARVSDNLGIIAEAIREADLLVKSGHLQEALESYGIAIEASDGKCARALLGSAKIFERWSVQATNPVETRRYYKRSIDLLAKAIVAGRDWPLAWERNAEWGKAASQFGASVGPFSRSRDGIREALIASVTGNLDKAETILMDLADLGNWQESESLFFLADVLMQRAELGGAGWQECRSRALEALRLVVAGRGLQSGLFPRNEDYAKRAVTLLGNLLADRRITSEEYGRAMYGPAGRAPGA